MSLANLKIINKTPSRSKIKDALVELPDEVILSQLKLSESPSIYILWQKKNSLSKSKLEDRRCKN